MKSLLTSIFVFFTLTGGLLPAQELLTLEDAFALALQDNPTIRIARNTAQISENNAHIGNAGLLPRLDLQSTANYRDQELLNNFGVRTEDQSTTASAGLNFSYTIFNGFGRIYSYKQLKRNSEYGAIQSRFQIENLLTGVASAYFAVAKAGENYNISKETLDISRERLQRAINRSQFGQANTIEVLSARVDMNTDSVAFLNARLDYEQAKRSLNVLLNRDPDTDFTVLSDVRFKPDFQMETLQQLAETQNAEYLLQKKRIEQAETDVKLAASNYYPQISLQSNYAYNQTARDLHVEFDDPYRNFTAGVSLNFNLFNGFKNSIQSQNARIQLKNEQLLKDDLLLNLRSEIKNTYAAYQNSLYVRDVQRQNVQAAELNFLRTRELFNLGQVTTTQFREAQRNLNQARFNLSAAKYNAKLYEIELYRLTGQLLSD